MLVSSTVFCIAVLRTGNGGGEVTEVLYVVNNKYFSITCVIMILFLSFFLNSTMLTDL